MNSQTIECLGRYTHRRRRFGYARQFRKCNSFSRIRQCPTSVSALWKRTGSVQYMIGETLAALEVRSSHAPLGAKKHSMTRSSSGRDSNSKLASSFPKNDGWNWLYQIYERYIRPHSWLRNVVVGYFSPTRLEMAENGKIYRLLGVSLFGKYIPTGGAAIRRMTGARMAAYTLSGLSIYDVRDFRYRTCVFEMLHIPFILTLLVLSGYRLLTGRPDVAAENMFVNLVFNIFPAMHQRNTRVRIDRLLRKWEGRIH